jgi:hypothetical protein
VRRPRSARRGLAVFEWLKPGRDHAVMTLTEVEVNGSRAKRQMPTATPEMLAKRAIAFNPLRAQGGLSDLIPDPLAWQREAKEDGQLPGRE